MHGESAYLFQGLSDETGKKILAIEREVSCAPGIFFSVRTKLH